jgi:hypothetical protein
MQPFYIENGVLRIGKPIILPGCRYDNEVEDYNVLHQDKQPGIYSEENEKGLKQKLDQFNQFMDLKIKPTPDNKYCAVYSPNYLYCDFYKQEKPEQFIPIVGNPDKPEYVEQARAKYLFTLKRNMYYAECHEFIIEFVTHPTTKEQLFLFNDKHGQLSVYNMHGQLIHRDKDTDKFITKLKIINEKYMIAHCWAWSPIYFHLLYNLDELLTTPNHDGAVNIWTEGSDDIYEIIDNDKIKFIQLSSCSYSNEFNPEYHKIVKEYTCSLDEGYKDNHYIWQSLFTPVKEYWQKDNLVKKILNGKQYAKTNISIQSPEKIELLNKLSPDQRLFIDCIDNGDKDHRYWLVNRIIGLDDSDDLPKSITLARFYHLDDDRDVDISLIFKADEFELTMKFNIKMIDKKFSPECVLNIVVL